MIPRAGHEYLRDFEGFGLAPYNRYSKWTYYCSPMKVSEYTHRRSGHHLVRTRGGGDHQGGKAGHCVREGNLEEIRAALDDFDVTDFHLRAQTFYAAFDSDTLFERVGL